MRQCIYLCVCAQLYLHIQWKMFAEIGWLMLWNRRIRNIQGTFISFKHQSTCIWTRLSMNLHISLALTVGAQRQQYEYIKYRYCRCWRSVFWYYELQIYSQITIYKSVMSRGNQWKSIYANQSTSVGLLFWISVNVTCVCVCTLHYKTTFI